MANNWPDGGEQPLSATEKWLLGIGAVGLVAAGLTYALLLGASAVGLQLTRPGVIVLGLMMLVLATAWVQPWEQGPTKPPKPSGRRPSKTP